MNPFELSPKPGSISCPHRPHRDGTTRGAGSKRPTLRPVGKLPAKEPAIEGEG